MEDQITQIQPAINMTTVIQEKITHKRNIFQITKDVSRKPYFEDKKHRAILFKEDCFDVLPNLPENSIDMIFVSSSFICTIKL